MLDLKSQITMTSEVFSQETFPSLHRLYYASFWTWGHAKNSHGWENIGRESLVTAYILKSDSAFQTKNLCVNRGVLLGNRKIGIVVNLVQKCNGFDWQLDDVQEGKTKEGLRLWSATEV